MQVSLYHARDQKRWSLEELERRSGVDKSTISRLERGVTSPKFATVLALEKALGLKRGSLVFGVAREVA